MTSRGRLALRVALLVALASPSAAAPPRMRVLVAIEPSCEHVDLHAVRRAMAIELDTAVELETPRRPDETVITPAGTTRVAIGCRPGRAVIEVDDPLTEKTLTRALPWDSATVETRNRLLAVGASELVIASWAELAVTRRSEAPPPQDAAQEADRQAAKRAVAPRLVAAPPPAAPPPRVRPVAEALPRAPRLAALAIAQTFFTGAGTLWGGGVAIARDEAHRLGWIVDASGAHGSVRAASGHVAIDRIDLGVGGWLHRRWQRVTLRGGPGLRVSAVRFAGTPSDPRTIQGLTFWAPALGFALAGSVQLALSSRYAFVIGVEVGYVAVAATARAYDVKVVAIEGPWVSATLGLAVFP